ncbi:hypothetical protein [Thalassobacillus sp. CUG 92003]|nr:hypothetical protein [Thalassobacillus sp. CUG 92003]
MKQLLRKAVSYAQRNPEKTKHYARKAYNTVQNKRKGRSSSSR